MTDAVEAQLVERWRDIMRRNQEVLQIWRESEFRLRVHGIDITEAEIGAAEARIQHIARLIAALEKAKENWADDGPHRGDDETLAVSP